MVHWDIEYFNITVEKYQVIYPDETSDYISNDDLTVLKSFFCN